MAPNDRDALIERVKAQCEEAIATGGREQVNPVDVLEALASPSPAQTETADDEEDDFPDLPKCKHGVGIFGDRIKCEECDAESASAGPPGVWLDSPSKWPEDVVERAIQAWVGPEYRAKPKREHYVKMRAVLDSAADAIFSKTAALATLPPERVKGLVEALEGLLSIEQARINTGAFKPNSYGAAVIGAAQGAVASYRGGA